MTHEQHEQLRSAEHLGQIPAEPLTRAVREFGLASKHLDDALRDHLAVNRTDMRAVSALIRHGGLTAAELARHLGVKPAATSAALDRLERAGHVERAAHPSDRRRVVVTVTPTSSERARHALTPMIDAIDALQSRLDDDQRAVIMGFLTEIGAIISAQVERLRAEPTGTHASSTHPSTADPSTADEQTRATP